MRALANAAAREDIEVDSAGIGAWHAGGAPDPRSVEAAQRRGYELDCRARQVRDRDFDEFDLLLAMDRSNLRDLRSLAPGEDARAKVRLLREYDPACAGMVDLDVRDPYYGGERGFDEVLDQIEAACQGLLTQLSAA